MLKDCQIYESGARGKGSLFNVESLLMSIIFNQQKLIEQLLKEYNINIDISRQQTLI
jgi:hypothetical protein